MNYDLDYFRQRSTEDTVTGCWNWQQARNAKGYGVMNHGGSARLAHRVALAIAEGLPVSEMRVVCYGCDNPGCVNPAHLVNGTHASNQREMVDRNRNQFGDTHWRAKLCSDDAREIAQRVRTGENTVAIGMLFGVSASVVSEIGSGTAWRRSA